MRRVGIALLSAFLWLAPFILLSRFFSPEGILVSALGLLLLGFAFAFAKVRRWRRRRVIARISDTAETIRFHEQRRGMDAVKALLTVHGWVPEDDPDDTGMVRFRRSHHGALPQVMLTALDDAGLLPRLNNKNIHD